MINYKEAIERAYADRAYHEKTPYFLEAIMLVNVEMHKELVKMRELLERSENIKSQDSGSSKPKPRA